MFDDIWRKGMIACMLWRLSKLVLGILPRYRYSSPPVLFFIQYIARNWPWYSLRGLYIRITRFSLYGIRIPLFSSYGIHMPLFPYTVIQPIVHCVVLWAAMDSPLSLGPLLWRHNDTIVNYFAEYARTWARHPTTPWQRECTAITDFQSIHSL